MAFLRSRLFVPLVILCLSSCISVVPAKFIFAQDSLPAGSSESKLTEEEMKHFLLNAKVIAFKQSSKGVTNPYKLTLRDGNLTHDGGFQSVDIYKPSEQFADGTREMNFRDSYHYNIAGFELAKLLGLGSMVPVTVARKWRGNEGSLTWWLDAPMDEGQRRSRKIQPPDVPAWEKQMDSVLIFSELIYDKDRNQTNIMISPDWKIYMIDFTRAFRLYKDLANPKNLRHCSRQLLEKLRQLDADTVTNVTKPHLNKNEIQGLMARRDKIVAYFEKQIAEKGESEILY